MHPTAPIGQSYDIAQAKKYAYNKQLEGQPLSKKIFICRKQLLVSIISSDEFKTATIGLATGYLLGSLGKLAMPNTPLNDCETYFANETQMCPLR